MKNVDIINGRYVKRAVDLGPAPDLCHDFGTMGEAYRKQLTEEFKFIKTELSKDR